MENRKDFIGRWKRSPPNRPFIWRAPHHAYLGIFGMIFFAFFAWTSAPYYPATTNFCIGGFVAMLYILIDDLIEHLVTKDTPLRLFFEKWNFWLK